MVAYLEAGPQVRTYSNYLRATWEAEEKDSLELSWGSGFQTTDSSSKPRTTSFFLLRKLKGNQPHSRKPTVHVTQLEEEDTDDGEGPESDDLNGLEGVMEEFMV